MFDGLATILIQGPTDEHVIQVTEMVEGAVDEMNRRIQAPPGTVFPPLIVLVDEAQVAFMCPAKDEDKRPYGGSKANSRYFMAVRKIHNQGRAVNVLMWQGTQDPTEREPSQAGPRGRPHPRLPRPGHRVAGPHGARGQGGRRRGGAEPAASGAGSGNAGRRLRRHRPSRPASRPSRCARTTSTTTRPKPSPTGPRPCATASPPCTPSSAARSATRSPTSPPWSATRRACGRKDVLARLATLNADAYGGWSFIDLKRVLDDTGAEPYKSDGVMVVGRDRVARALANRDGDGSASAAG